MTTQTQNSNAVFNAGQPYRGIFSMKTIILLTILVITSFSYKAKAQNTFTWSNSSNCDWQITFIDAGSGILGSSPYALNGPSSGGSLCGSPFSGTVDQMVIYDLTSCNLVFFTINGGTQGGIPTYCGYNCTAFNTTFQIDVSHSVILCSGISTDHFTITITP